MVEQASYLKSNQKIKNHIIISAHKGRREMIDAKLYFGLVEKSGKVITNLEFYIFVENDIVPRFQGFTILDAKGYYKSSREYSKVVIVLTEPEKLYELQKVAREYKKRFNQTAVLLTTHESRNELI